MIALTETPILPKYFFWYNCKFYHQKMTRVTESRQHKLKKAVTDRVGSEYILSH